MQPNKSERAIKKSNSNLMLDIGKSHPTMKYSSEEMKSVLILYVSGSVGANNDDL